MQESLAITPKTMLILRREKELVYEETRRKVSLKKLTEDAALEKYGENNEKMRPKM
jgi:hypothetical protein